MRRRDRAYGAKNNVFESFSALVWAGLGDGGLELSEGEWDLDVVVHFVCDLRRPRGGHRL